MALRRGFNGRRGQIVALSLLLGMTVIGTAMVTANLPVTVRAETSVLAKPRSLGVLQLQNAANNQAFTTAELADRWTLLYTGYLNCPDLCPTTLAMLARLVEQLPQDQQAQLQLAFASIDYQRDNAAEVASYARHFSENIVALTGSAEQLGALTRAVGFIAPPESELRPAGSTNTALPPRAIAHSSAIALINPMAQLHALFRYPHDVQRISTVLQQLLD